MSQTPSRVRPNSLLLLGMTILLLSGCSSGDGGGTGGPTGAACQSNCPTAQAGPEQAVVTGVPVTLDGSGSTSGTPGLITYQWTLLSKPTGSAATLAGATTARPTFTADVAGTYAARLVVQEGGVSSSPATVTITCGTGNLAPMADAGLDRTEPLGTPVTLDGTGSRDPNGTPITYAWRVVTQPSGSQAVLLSATSKTPSFTPQVAGPYTLALTVSDGALTSPSDEVVITVTADNCPPAASAGPDQKVTTGQVVTLTGAGSTDPNDDFLTYSWRFQSKPDGSTAAVAAATSVSPTFTADLAGLYVLSLVVSDGTRTSAPDTVVIEATLPGFVNLVLQAYLKPSNTFSGQPAVDFFPGNQFGVSVAISGDTLAVGGPTDSGCASANCGVGTGGTGAVYVFTRTTGGWSQQAYVRASNPIGGNVEEGFHPAFGTSVALSGDTLAVGAIGENGCATGVNGDQANQNCPLRGAVYVFTRTNGIWAQQAYVKASNTGPYAYFGRTLALTGDTLAVGSYDLSGFSGSGVVSVFTRTTGVWSQQAYLKASNADDGDEFGSASVALDRDGNTLAVGARGEDSCAPGINGDQTNNGCKDAGAVYVFTRTNGIWGQQAYIKASNPGGEILNGDSTFYGDSFGSSVALSGDTLAVGARWEQSCASGINGDQTNNGCIGEGAAYVFTRANGSWAQQVYIKASNTGGNRGGFGWSVALNGNTLAVGRPYLGAVYVFKRAAGVWSQHFYVKAPSPEGSSDNFGTSVALSNELLVVGAPNEASCATGVNGNQTDNNCYLAGAAYVYGGQQ